ncbi:unnamed protein product [Cuscuta epithymum]|uniref:Acidic leucine-rich nuclear phosphoprotein 32-related protein n=1 Tax=Cuscuta epithymum TaxID=186058 RepID=A0AAV0G237_9ASTE|nr:unnamed protein product [Cuscuta epithymum]
MGEIWEKAVETALDGQKDFSSVRSLTLDGLVKCVNGRLPPPSLFERFQNLQHLSIASIGVSTLEHFPRLQNLQKLILSDNRISGGLEFLVKAGLHSLRDLDLSNNRIQDVTVLSPLAELKLISLDLYECPVTKVKDYRSNVLGLIKSLKYLDKMDAEGNERPESDEEEDDESDEEDDEDPGSGEVDGEDRPHTASNGRQSWSDKVIDVDEDESDADEVELDTSRGASEASPSRSHNLSNGFRVAKAKCDDEGDEEDDEDSDWDEEIDEDDEDDVLEVHNIEDGDDEDDEDGVEDDDEDLDDGEDGEEVDNDDSLVGDKQSTDLIASTEGEIDGHDGEEDSDEDEEENVETGEDDFDDEDDVDEEEEEDNGAGYLVQPVGHSEAGAAIRISHGDDGEDDEDGEVQELASLKRKREEEDGDDDSDEEDDDDDDGDDDDDDSNDGVLENGRPPKRQR